MGLTEIRTIKAQALIPKVKVRKPIPKYSAKRQRQIQEQKQSGDSRLDIFFEAMRKKCKGKCLFCNGGTTYRNDELWRISIAHLLPKSKFASIGTHESNWVELCMQCHRSFDDGTISWMLLKDSKEWEVIKEKLFEVLPLVAEEERKNKLYSKLIELIYH